MLFDEGALYIFSSSSGLIVRNQLHIHMYVFDETFKTLQGQGSVVDLAPWYSQARISILQMTFVTGNEEVVLVDSSARARIFSFITLQFRCDFQSIVGSRSMLLTGTWKTGFIEASISS